MSSPITQRVKEPADPSQASSAATSPDALHGNSKLINWSAFLFALLQSVCSAIIALNGVRLLIGVGAFAAASGALKLADRMHIAAIRIPMMVLALAGSVLNLVVLWQGCRRLSVASTTHLEEEDRFRMASIYSVGSHPFATCC